MPKKIGDPLEEAVETLIGLWEGVGQTLDLLDKHAPLKGAPPQEKAFFSQFIMPIVADAHLSIAMASGEIAFHLRRLDRDLKRQHAATGDATPIRPDAAVQ